MEAIDLNVSAPVITESLMRRIRSREVNNFTDRMLAILRSEFGGHAVKKSNSASYAGSSGADVRWRRVSYGNDANERSARDLSQVPQGSERIPEPGILVIFGASGDLTNKRSCSGALHLEQAKLLPEKFAIVGVARRALV